MTEVKHTPLPWITAGRNGAGDHIHGNDGEVAWCRTYVGIPSETIKANAEFIVRACNSHYELLDAARRAEAMIELLRATAYQIGLEGTKEWDELVVGCDLQGTCDVIVHGLAKAEGRA